jgi:hypothetical protein
LLRTFKCERIGVLVRDIGSRRPLDDNGEGGPVRPLAPRNSCLG